MDCQVGPARRLRRGSRGRPCGPARRAWRVFRLAEYRPNAFIGQLANINQDIDRQIELLSALDADNVGFRLLDEVQYPDAPE